MKKKNDRPPTKKKAEQKEPQFMRSATGEQTINYHVYYMSAAEKTGYFLAAFAVGAIVGYIFYGGIGVDVYGEPTILTHILNAAVMVVCGMVTGKVFLPIRQEQILNARRRKLRSQFRDMLEALSTALGAGSNVPEAFQSAYHDLLNQYEESDFILQELNIINIGLTNGSNLEKLLDDFGRRSAILDIQDFASVFEICYRKGGNIRETIQNTCQILRDKMSVEEEIETTVAGSKNELYLMLVMPVGLIGMIKFSSPDFASNFVTMTGLASTTVAVMLFGVSYFLGKKILDIQV